MERPNSCKNTPTISTLFSYELLRNKTKTKVLNKLKVSFINKVAG